MLWTNYKTPLVRRSFEENLQPCKDIYIASGYFGKSELDRQANKLISKARDGGSVALIHGLASAEGLTENLYKSMLHLHEELASKNPQSGVFVSEARYHGKLYLTLSDESQSVMIGSSNFSSSGFESNIELNFESEDISVWKSSKNFFDQLYAQSHAIDLCDIRIKGKASTKTTTTKSKSTHHSQPNRSHDFEIPIRIQPRSSLNLFLSRGRLNSNTGRYVPRPFYEVEVTIPRELWTTPITNFIPNSTQPVYLKAHTDTGEMFDVVFKRKTSSKDDTRGLHTTGGDFMSSPRELLGRYLKGKLMRSGVLHYGEPITSDTLAEYGESTIRIWFIDSENMFIAF